MKKELIFGVTGIVIIISFLILIIFKSLPKKNTNPSSKKPINEKNFQPKIIKKLPYPKQQNTIRVKIVGW